MTSPTFEQASERAMRHAESGNWDAARADWLQALAHVPDSADVMLELSCVASFAGDYRDARQWALRAAKARPRSIDAVLSLVHRLRTFNEVPILRGLVKYLLDKQQVPHGLLVECARQLSNLNDFELALRCAQAAVAQVPEDLGARVVRGQLLASYGRVDEAVADFHYALQRNPRMSIAWWLLSRLQKQTRQSNHAAQLQALLRRPGLPPADVAALSRALHKQLDDIGDHEGAWQALEMLCRVKRSVESYDAAAHRQLVDRLIAWMPDAAASPTESVTDKVPVFIVGMYRSGTTLMERMLDASPQVRALGELTDFTSAMRYATDHYCKGPLDQAMVERAPDIDFADVGQRYLAGVAWRLGGERFFTDKLPSNFLNLGFICRALPQAKILHMVRDPMETCFSNLRELFSEVNAHTYDQREMADYFLQYRRLMAHWHATFPGQILDVDYTRLTADPEATIREVAAFAGIDYVDAMQGTAASTRAVGTASSIQVRQGVVRHATPKWKPYESRLQPLMQALREGGVEIARAMA